jgi:hypothetical protein
MLHLGSLASKCDAENVRIGERLPIGKADARIAN